jgi:hypothetical protein
VYTEGIPNSTTSSCVPIPEECLDNPTCECLGRVCGTPAPPSPQDGCGCGMEGCRVECVNP